MLMRTVRLLLPTAMLFGLASCGNHDFNLEAEPAGDGRRGGLGDASPEEDAAMTQQQAELDAGTPPADTDARAALDREASNVARDACETDDNLIHNCSFTAGLFPWIFATSGEARATANVQDGTLRIDVSVAVANPWEIQPYQAGINLKSGTQYEVRLDIWATRSQTIEVYVTHNASPWDKYQQLNANVDTSRKTYSGRLFGVDSDDPNVKLEIWLPNAKPGDAVFVDDVFLVPVSETDGGSNPGQSDVPAGATTRTLCDRFGSTTVRGGEYAIHNGVWGATTPQCTTVWETATEFGFAVDAEHTQLSGMPSAYPFVRKGWHWGDWTKRSGLPKRVDVLKSAASVWTYRVPSSGQYNVSFDLWLSPDSNPKTPAHGVELMIWTTRHGAWPAGVPSGAASLAGHDWNIYRGPMNDWTYIAYVATTDLGSVNFDLRDFLMHAKSEGWLGGDWSLLSVEAGFEIWRGGHFDLDSFSTTIQ